MDKISVRCSRLRLTEDCRRWKYPRISEIRTGAYSNMPETVTGSSFLLPGRHPCFRHLKKLKTSHQTKTHKPKARSAADKRDFIIADGALNFWMISLGSLLPAAGLTVMEPPWHHSRKFLLACLFRACVSFSREQQTPAVLFSLFRHFRF